MNNLSTDDIETMVYNILDSKANGTFDEKEFILLKTELPSLYEMVISEDMDLNIFKHFIKMKRKLDSGEDSYKVDVKVGEFMAERYIDPVVKKLKKS
jgi:hypothetical protein